MTIKDINDTKCSIANLELSKNSLENQQKKYRQENGTTSPSLTKALKTISTDIKNRKEVVKGAAMSMERENYNHLIFIASDNNYYKLAGHSVIIYSAQIATRIGRRYNLKNDTDFYFKSEYGVISIELTEEIIARLKAIQIVQNPKLSKPDILVFDLPWTFSEEDIKRLYNENRLINEQITSLIIPQNSIPALYDLLRSLNRDIYFNCSKMEQLARTTVGENLFNISSTMMSRYVELTNDNKILKENLLKIYKGALYIKNSMKIVEELRLINQKEIKEILEKTTEIIELTNRKYRQELKNEKLNSNK